MSDIRHTSRALYTHPQWLHTQASFAQPQPGQMADQQHQHLEPRQSAFAAQQAQSLAAEALQEGSPMRSPSGPMAAAALGVQPFASPAMGGGDGGAPEDRQRTPSVQLPSPGGFQGFGPAPQPGQTQQGSQAVSASPLSQPPIGRCAKDGISAHSSQQQSQRWDWVQGFALSARVCARLSAATSP